MMQSINVEMVRERAREIRESVGKIRAYAAQPDADFFADERNLYTVMYLLPHLHRSGGRHLQSPAGQNRPQVPGQLR